MKQAHEKIINQILKSRSVEEQHEISKMKLVTLLKVRIHFKAASTGCFRFLILKFCNIFPVQKKVKEMGTGKLETPVNQRVWMLVEVS